MNWTDNLMVKANPPRVHEPRVGHTYWFSTATCAPRPAVLTGETGEFWVLDGYNEVRKCDTSVYNERPR